MSEIRFIDTTLRDGQQSLWALGMRTEWMLPAVQRMDQAGFDSIDFYVPSIQIHKAARDLGENGLNWLSMGSKLARTTRLRLMGGFYTGFGAVPRSVVKLLLTRVVDSGITVTRRSDPWNDYEVLGPEVRVLEELGFDVVVDVIYSVSPKHTDEYYEKCAADAAELNPYRVGFKDVGGLLTPERARVLIPKILRAVGDVPLEFHAHCNTGLAPLCYVEAAKCGVKYLHTAIPPLANGSSNPSVFNTASNLRVEGFVPAIDEGPLVEVSRHFDFIAQREDLPRGTPPEYDASIYGHQIPGGMISNMRHQLEEVGQGHRLGDALNEASRVRVEFGYPIMITPLSQFVGSQAALNVMSGDRYSVVSDATIEYALGKWGRQAISEMDQEVRWKILDRPRAEEIAGAEDPADETLSQVRARYGKDVSDEELIIRAYAKEYADRALASPPPPEGGSLTGREPVIDLMEKLSHDSTHDRIDIRKQGFRLSLWR